MLAKESPFLIRNYPIFSASATSEKRNHFVKPKGMGELSLKEASAFERPELSQIAIVYTEVKILKTSFLPKIKFEISFREAGPGNYRDKRL